MESFFSIKGRTGINMEFPKVITRGIEATDKRSIVLFSCNTILYSSSENTLTIRLFALSLKIILRHLTYLDYGRKIRDHKL
ncbi:hypothetical protein GCM10008968_30070 [Bacillus horti]